MNGRHTILARSAARSSLPLARARAAAAGPGIAFAALKLIVRFGTAPRQQQRSRSSRSPNWTLSPLRRAGASCPEAPVVTVGKFETRTRLLWSRREENRERGGVVRQALSLAKMSQSVLFTARAGSSPSGTEAEELPHATSSSSGSSEEYLVGGKYCVLLTGHASDYTEKLYGGYGQMFVKLLGDAYDKWDIYAVVDGQFPAEEELEKYDGFLITGSKHDAHGSDEWITKLCSLLQSLHDKKRNILGICFGHQVLSRALGGKTGRTNVGWELGLRHIQTTPALASKAYAVGVPQVFTVMESHQDQVHEMPPGAELLGFSERTPIEVFAIGDHILGIQGHPEFTNDVVTDIIDTRFSLGILTEEEANEARATLRAGEADREALVWLCKRFLKRS